MSDGWIKLHRRALNSAAWKDKDVWRLWTWMLIKASHKDHQTMFRKSPVKLSAGQLLFSLSIASEETGLSIRTVRTCLGTLLTLENVTIQTTKRFSIISITNWMRYQGLETPNDTLPDNEATNRRHTLLKNKNGKKKDTLAQAQSEGDFEQFWEAYPKKRSKDQALKAWNKLNGTRPKLETLLSAIAAQSAGHDWQKDGGQFVPYPATWLNGRRWEDDLASACLEPQTQLDQKPTGISAAEYMQRMGLKQ